VIGTFTVVVVEVEVDVVEVVGGTVEVASLSPACDLSVVGVTHPVRAPDPPPPDFTTLVGVTADW
jgi:hypothetical protein